MSKEDYLSIENNDDDDNEKETESMPSCRRVLFEENDDEITEGAPNMDVIHSKISKELIPIEGKEFASEVEAHQFYNRYAKAVGFGTRQSNSHKDENGFLLDKIFCCCCEGTRGKDKRSAYVKQHRAITRFGCAAMMKISSRIDGRLRIIKFEPQHNHLLSTPSKTHFFRSHRKITKSQATELDMACNSGIAPKASMELMSQRVGGRENLGFLRVDCNNYLRKKRDKEMKAGDTGGVLEYLQRKQIEDPKFFYAIQVDVDDLITNIFWADAKMMSDYNAFGDVVCFDTTYKKNKECRPFAMFVGVNHHKQTTIFGAALLYDETIETFKWLFDTFVKAMQGKKPRTILTDQDQAMATALATVWPETYHRLCVWHIYQNAAKHLHHVFEGFKNFAQDFSGCVYDHDDEVDFLDAWKTMLQKYNLENNSWLQQLFALKEKWALVYGRETFCADMSTTQRSESMNSQVKRYVSYKNHLFQFFQHFERLLNDRRFDEKIADFKTNHTFPSLPYPVQILKHAASVYTAEVFHLFQASVWKAWDCMIEGEQFVGTTFMCHIIPPRKNVKHVVTFDLENSTISCGCKKFEFVGILCSHALKVLCSRNIKKIPDQYILKRWRKDAKVGNSPEKFVSTTAKVDEKMASKIRFQELGALYNNFSCLAAETEETYNFALDVHKKSLAQVEVMLKKLICRDIDDDADANGYEEDLEQNIPKEQCEISKVKGIKFKGGRGRGKGRGNGSARCKSSLETSRNHKKHRSETSKNQNNETNDTIGKSINPGHSQAMGHNNTFNSGMTQVGNYIPPFQASQQYILASSNQVMTFPGPSYQQSSYPHFDATNNQFSSWSLTQLLNEQMSTLGAHEIYKTSEYRSSLKDNNSED